MPNAEKRFLVIKLADVGDVLTATPALRAIHETHPMAKVDVLTSTSGAAILAGNQSVDEAIVADRHLADSPRSLARPRGLITLARTVSCLRRRHYEVAFLMHHLSTPVGALKWRALSAAVRADLLIGLDNGRGSFLHVRVHDRGFGVIHEVEYGLEVAAAAGAAAADHSLSLTIPDPARREADALVDGLSGPIVAVHPGSGGFSLARRWPTKRFAALADALIERYQAAPVLVGSSSDGVAEVRALMRRPALDLSGRTSLMALAAVVERCALFVGNDSGVMHVAAATTVPLLAIFGPSNARAWGPWRPESAVPTVTLVGDCPRGAPCLYTGHSVGLRDGCPERHCLTAITVEQVMDAIASMHVL